MADDNDTAPPADEADDAVTAGESMVSAPKDATDAELDSALQAVNMLRAKHGCPEVELDMQASALAQDRARNMAKTGTLTHWAADGTKPYHAYFDGGVAAHVEESIWGKEEVGDIDSMDALIFEAHDSFAKADEEGAPEGAYWRNLTNKFHTHVGFGATLEEGHFRYVVVFVDRYMKIDASAPTEIHGDEEVVISGQMINDKFGPFGVAVYLDPPMGAMSDMELADLKGPYSDYTDDQLLLMWPWNIDYAGDGSFSITLNMSTLAKQPTAGALYVQIFVKEDPDSIPRDRVEGVEVPGEDTVCAAGWVLKLIGDADGAGIDGDSLDSAGKDDENFSLEEHAARRTALAMAAKPDGAPLSSIAPLVGVGMLQPPPGSEATLYMQVERQEQVTCQNLALSFDRIDFNGEGAAASAEDTKLVSDVVVVETAGDAAPVAPEGYELVPGDLLPEVPKSEGDDAAADPAAPHVYLAVKRVPLSGADTPPLVDLALVYGAWGDVASDGTSFTMSGGYETLQMPDAVNRTYKATIYLCTKREGAGGSFAANVAARAAAEAAASIEQETGGAGGSAMGDGFDMEDELLDTSLSPEQIRELEEQRAAEARERAMEQEAETAEIMRAQYSASLRNKLKQAEERREEVSAKNSELQRKIVTILASQKRVNDTNAPKVDKDADVPNHESEKQYSDTLNSILDAHSKFKYMCAEFDRVAMDLQKRLDDKEAKASDIAESFSEFKAEIALQAEHSRTGKPIAKRTVQMFQEQEGLKDQEAVKVRLRNINLRMILRKLELSLRAKEQLAEGLHLIDFEQLKIENQTLNEKIEERNEELHKLRKKNTSNVQVLTHIKEKLQFVSAENSVTRDSLASLDSELSKERDLLTKAKREKEALRAENAALKQKQGFTNSDLLVVDFESRKQELISMREKIADLKQRYSLLASVVERADGE
mmetsp:Transcript_17132/g.44529  ORF Transcript_17132/g.44529 Transcript_17132/m.44529 type:complete len:938 (+) Transcript_17132:131-2944(+)|eukprot:CAMPEP_0119510858 /NCGR_PEP_ID=MMETSP1344-20130328/29689_1 /TAXON_ID=236787 /ORGANISM="Florenciella parvula, Strain CCMP2471" /LENGTH=937 /DNA_ID=CAMNT_0007547807 /DNA_START=128 /DNA_END=2941 /DNA_ORIENTATION=-